MKKLKPHQERVVAEKAELDEKHAKLIAFGQSEQFASVDPAEQERLKRQSKIMDEYSQVLGERIAAFDQ
jgi:hypothetical protein